MAAGAAAGGAAPPPQTPAPVPTPVVLFQALTDGFSKGLFIAGVVTLAGFLVAIVTTWTPGRVAPQLGRARGQEQPCDEALGTCEAVRA